MSQTPERPPAGDEPGSASEPRDTTGDGPVGLEDRTEPGGQGSPDTNQAEAEPMPSTPGHRDPGAELTPPLLAEMNVGAGNVQLPSHSVVPTPQGPLPGEQPTDLGGAGTVPSEDRPVPDLAASTGRATGPEQPVQSEDGTSHRAPGLQGDTARGEAVGSDVHAGAARMQGKTGDASTPDLGAPGDSAGVPASSSTASAGTSEELTAVQGVRLPDADEATRS